ncbi:MAG: SIR2 family protein [Terasakiella sp.]|nr:SIR2 family protein [Terasakiella sp.]
MDLPLPEAYSVACGQGEVRASEFLRGLFTDCIPRPYHRTVASYPWYKIYTLNIDDLMEAAAPKGRLNIINSRHPMLGEPGRIDYVKLHGCVQNHSEGFVFSQEEYSRVPIADKRYADLTHDLSLHDFVIIGANVAEPDIKFALNQYTDASDTRRGNLFYVDPKPGYALSHRISQTGAHLIQLTCEEFARWLEKQNAGGRHTKKDISRRAFDCMFRRLRPFYDIQSSKDNSTTKLYEGYTPTWHDIFTDYDFRLPVADRICGDITAALSKGGREPIVAAVTGKAVGGKSTLLLRIGMTLLKQGYEVVEYIGQRFDRRLFAQYAPAIDDVVILLVDNGAKQYRVLSDLLDEYPADRRLVVVTVDRPFFHAKKHYELSHYPGYMEYNLDRALSDEMDALARSAVQTLDRKHLLGRLLGKSDQERMKHFTGSRDLVDALWQLNHGEHFEARLSKSYRRLVAPAAGNAAAADIAEVLYMLGVFYMAGLEYMPHTLLQIWKAKRYGAVIETEIADFVKPVDNRGIALRSEIIKNLVMQKSACAGKRGVAVIGAVLKHLKPFLSDAGSYWNAIQSRVMNVDFLDKDLHVSYTNIKRLLTDLADAYAYDPYYLIQLGKIEQRLGNYSPAYNHFNQAISLSPRSYNALNALARNYLRQATRDNTITKERALVLYNEGRRRMETLIGEREQYQVRAYSVHSLIVESVALWEKYGIEPTADDLKSLLGFLRLVPVKQESDKRMLHAGKKLMEYIERRKLTSRLLNLGLEDLAPLKSVLYNDEDFDDDLD